MVVLIEGQEARQARAGTLYLFRAQIIDIDN